MTSALLSLMLLLVSLPAYAGKPSKSNTVTVSAPSPASGTVTVSGKATGGGGLLRLEVYRDGGLIDSCPSSPCNYAWNTKAVANGVHVLTAKRYDTNGTVTTSAPLQVIVSNDSTPPTVSLNAPSTASGTVPLSASATDASGVATTELYIDGALVSSASGGSLSYSWDTTAASNGAHSVQALARDPAGNVGTSPVSPVWVDNTAPSGFDFSLVSYGPNTVTQGHPVYIGLASQLLAGDGGTHVYLSAQDLPPGTTASFPDLQKTCCQNANGYFSWNTAFNTALAVNTSASTPLGTYSVRVTAAGGDVTRTVTHTVQVLALDAIPQTTPTYFPPIPEFTGWQTNMVTYGQMHCDEATILQYGTWEGSVWYYDGQRVYYQIADYTGDPFWNTCSRYVREVYRDSYVLPNNGVVGGWRIFPHGLHQDFLRTGDSLSKDAVLLMAQNAGYANPATPWASVIDAGVSREVAYNIMSYMVAQDLGASRHPNFDAYVEIALGHIDQWAVSQSTFVKPFMVGLTSEALIKYHARTGDPRVLPAIKTAMDWIWDHTWVPSAGAFLYIDHDGVPNQGASVPAPDLNLLIAPAYAWLYRQTGDPVYQQRGDLIFAGGVLGAWLDGGKQFSQDYRWSFDYVNWRSGM